MNKRMRGRDAEHQSANLSPGGGVEFDGPANVRGFRIAVRRRGAENIRALLDQHGKKTDQRILGRRQLNIVRAARTDDRARQ
jgi:hypothetical protein